MMPTTTVADCQTSQLTPGAHAERSAGPENLVRLAALVSSASYYVATPRIPLCTVIVYRWVQRTGHIVNSVTNSTKSDSESIAQCK